MSDTKIDNEKQTESTQLKDPYEKYRNAKLSPEDDVRNGPYEDDKRECRDIFFCLFFIAFIIGVIIVAYLGLFYGNPNKVLYPYDEDAHQCGRDDYKDYKYLYFYSYTEDAESIINPVANTHAHVICVKTCDYKEKSGENYIMDCKPTSKNHNCQVLNKDFYEANEGIYLYIIYNSDGQILYPKI